jgi:hypothetical protein
MNKDGKNPSAASQSIVMKDQKFIFSARHNCRNISAGFIRAVRFPIT